MNKHPFFLVFLAAVVFAAACASRPAAPAPPAFPAFDAQKILAHARTLSADEFEGRAPGTKGEELTVAYLADQFARAGLAPGNPDGSWFQTVPLVGITPDPNTSLTFRKGDTSRTMRFKDDIVAWTKRVAETVSLDHAGVVFVGYGVQAPEFGWDDFKGADLRGKTLVFLIGDPPVADPADPTKLDPKAFGGQAMTYYGRWSYKFEMAQIPDVHLSLSPRNPVGPPRARRPPDRAHAARPGARIRQRPLPL